MPKKTAKSVLTVTDYFGPKDIFTVTVVAKKQFTGSQLHALVEAKREFPDLQISAEEQALIELYEGYFAEVPHDMFNKPIEF